MVSVGEYECSSTSLDLSTSSLSSSHSLREFPSSVDNSVFPFLPIGSDATNNQAL